MNNLTPYYKWRKILLRTSAVMALGTAMEAAGLETRAGTVEPVPGAMEPWQTQGPCLAEDGTALSYLGDVDT